MASADLVVFRTVAMTLWPAFKALKLRSSPKPLELPVISQTGVVIFDSVGINLNNAIDTIARAAGFLEWFFIHLIPTALSYSVKQHGLMIL